jgi:hypothetical protein
MSAEEMHRDFDAPLAEIHAAIAYYLQHTAECEAYIEKYHREVARARTDAEADPGYQEARARILARWAEKQKRDRATG